MKKFQLFINDVDFSAIVGRYGYTPSIEPVKSAGITDLDGVVHTKVIRWRHTLSVQVNPLTDDMALALAAELKKETVSVRYFSPQDGKEITIEIQPVAQKTPIGLDNDQRYWQGGTLDFVEV